MTCGEARELIQKSLGGKMEEAERSGVDGHLAACPGCRKYASVFTALRARLATFAAESSIGAESPLSRFLSSLAAPSVSSGPPAGYAARRPPFTYAAAAAVLVAAAVFIAIALLAPTSLIAQTTVREHRLRMAGTLVLDSHADCCKDLKDWFEEQVNRPVAVPDIKIKGIVVEGGKLYRHSTGNEFYFVAARLDGKPVSLFVCCGPNMALPEGEKFSLGGRTAVLTEGGDHTMISWRDGEFVNVLLTCCGPEKSKTILAGIE